MAAARRGPAALPGAREPAHLRGLVLEARGDRRRAAQLRARSRSPRPRCAARRVAWALLEALRGERGRGRRGRARGRGCSRAHVGDAGPRSARRVVGRAGFARRGRRGGGGRRRGGGRRAAADDALAADDAPRRARDRRQRAPCRAQLGRAAGGPRASTRRARAPECARASRPRTASATRRGRSSRSSRATTRRARARCSRAARPRRARARRALATTCRENGKCRGGGGRVACLRWGLWWGARVGGLANAPTTVGRRFVCQMLILPFDHTDDAGTK